MITQDCPPPVVAPEPVLMQVALFDFGAAVAAEVRPAMKKPRETPESCTTTHFELLQTKRFWPPRFAICTTVCFVLAQVQRLPGQCAPA